MNKGMTIGTLAFVASLAMGCDTGGDTKTAPRAEAPATEVAAKAPGETLGFVFSSWRDEIPRDVEGGCPDGLNVTEFEHYGVDQKEFFQKARKVGMEEAEKDSFGGDACRDRASQPDPGHKSFQGATVMSGMDLDGVDSKSSDGGACPHADFPGPNGETGIDNQQWRLLGCTNGYQPDGQMDRMWESGNFIKEGIPILVEVTGVNDRQNDDEVEVRFLSSEDSVSMDSNGRVVPQMSLRAHSDPLYRNTPTKGRIENGVLTTEPVDLHLRVKQQVVDNAFYYRDARIRAELLPNGEMRGILGFYWDADNMFDVLNNHTIGKFHSGRIGASTRGYTCAGMNFALERLADGHPDPETGRCTSLSSAMHFEAVPAFVIQPEA